MVMHELGKQIHVIVPFLCSNKCFTVGGVCEVFELQEFARIQLLIFKQGTDNRLLNFSLHI